MTDTVTEACGLAYDPETNDWTHEVVYIARSRTEAVWWMNFNKAWLKDLKIVEQGIDQ